MAPTTADHQEYAESYKFIRNSLLIKKSGPSDKNKIRLSYLSFCLHKSELTLNSS